LPREKESGFTYADYKSWPAEERWEIIHGVPYSMSPAPGTEHQFVLSELGLLIGPTARELGCQYYVPATDVILPSLAASEDEGDTVVQPDLLVVCDKTKIRRHGIVGAPDMVVEILSPSTGFKDQSVKFSLYESAGVREYWLVNPETRVVEVFYRSDVAEPFGAPAWYRDPGLVKSRLLGEELDLSGVWPSGT
jgi:Uma2 family endonuclease